MTQHSHEAATCFVISPIGAEESEVRLAADDFLELLLEPVLTSYRFNVVRADKMATPTAITADIVRLVQEAELCVIDLTGHNANVFYECGRRHETGRPFIQMVSKAWEERIPFDVAGIRTLTYDLSNPRTVLASQNALRAFIDAIVSGEVDQKSTGASISTVAQSIVRVERKLDALTTLRSRQSLRRGVPEDRLDLMVMAPRDAWFACMRSGDLDGAMEQLDRLKRAVPYREYVSAMTMLLAAGSEDAFPLMEGEINTLIDQAREDEPGEEGWETLSNTILGLSKYFANYGKTREGVPYIQELISRIPDRVDGRRSLATILNSVGMMAWTDDDLETCIEYTRRAYDKFDGEPAYVYNLLLAYKKISGENDPNFQQWLDRLAAFEGLRPIHQSYLTRHGRTYAGRTIEGSEEQDEGNP